MKALRITVLASNGVDVDDAFVVRTLNEQLAVVAVELAPMRKVVSDMMRLMLGQRFDEYEVECLIRELKSRSTPRGLGGMKP